MTRSTFSCHTIIIYCPGDESVVAGHVVPYTADVGRAVETNECRCTSSVLGAGVKIQTENELEKEKSRASGRIRLAQALPVTVYIVLAHKIDNGDISTYF